MSALSEKEMLEKFPADRLADICHNIDAFVAAENTRSEALLTAKTFAEIKAAWTKQGLPG